MRSWLWLSLSFTLPVFAQLPADWGERHTWHHQLEAWCRVQAERSDRVRFETYGRSVEGRALMLAVVTSPANHRRMETILERARSLRAGGEVAARQPAVVWFSCGIHGNELSPTEGAIKLIHTLATSDDAGVRRILDETVVVVDPLVNPDGRDRFVSFYRGTVSDVSSDDPQAMEHNQDWPSGRTNHFLFDLNRDWFLLSQDESRLRAAALLKYAPQVVVDAHEMGGNSSFFFPPPAPPLSPIIGDLAKTWWERLGRSIAADFDARKWSYWTKEVFDLFYPGYGGSWANYKGAVAMTFEQGSARGRSLRRNDGSLLTLRDASEHQYVAYMATLREVAENKKRLLDDVVAHFERSREKAAKDPIKGFVLTPRPRPDATARLVSALAAQGIELLRCDTVVEVGDLVPLAGGAGGSVSLPAGSWIVPCAQPDHDLVRVLLQRDVPMTEAFLKEDRERVERGERSFIYDVTSWNMALTYGVEAYELHGAIPAAFEPSAPVAARPGGITTLSGKPGEAYAWIVTAHGGAAARILPELAKRELAVRITTFDMTSVGVPFPAGSAVVLAARNGRDAATRVAAAARAAGVEVHAVGTSWNERGFDLGSNRVVPWRAPRVAVLGDEPASAYSFGSVRYYLERVLGLPYVSLRTSSVSRYDLAKYDVLIVPAGGDYARWLGESGSKKVSEWVRRGGVLVTIGSGRSVAGESSGLKPKKMPASADRVRGALVRLNVRPRHWLGYGLPDGLIGQIRSRTPLEGEAGVVTYAKQDDLLVSGLMGSSEREVFAESVFLGAKSQGQGHVIVFTEDLLVRANMVGLMPLFGNAVLLGPTFR